MSELILLSIIQGVTEFIPISSSAHLILASEFLEVNKNNITLDISLHIGSFFGIIFYYTKNIENFLKNKKLLIKIFLSSIPVTIFGIILIKLNIVDYLRNYKVIGISTIIFGLLLYFSDINKSQKKIKKDFNYKSALIIGLFQILSLIPGASRSGITLTGARFIGFNKIEATKISFLTSIPILFYVSAYNFLKIIEENNFKISTLNLLGIVLSFCFSYLTIKFFLKFLKRFNLTTFVIYRIILGTLILIYVYVN
jgi:undecaprenyl-diphosphatase